MWPLVALILVAFGAAQSPSNQHPAGRPGHSQSDAEVLDRLRDDAEIRRLERLLTPLRDQRRVLKDREQALSVTIQNLAARNSALFESARAERDRGRREALHGQIAGIKKHKTQLLAEREQCRQEVRDLLASITDLEKKIRHIERKMSR